MSSHHIVRDEQEPALLFWQPGQLSFEQAGDLLEWSPRVVVHQQALEEALSWGIKLDAVWAVNHQLEQVAAAVAHQQPVKILPFEQEESLAEVLQWFKRNNQSSINLLADAAAHNFLLLQQLAPLQQLVQVQVISQGWRYSFFRNGSIQKWLPEGSHLRLIALEHQPTLNGAGLNKLQESQQVQEFTVQQAGVVKIEGAAPFWMGELL